MKFFKSKNQSPILKEEIFSLGSYLFRIDKSESIIQIKDNEIVDLTLKTSEQEFETYSETESFEFSWALYPPMFYARDLLFDKKKKFVINNTNKFDHEVALYLMEHNEVQVKISLEDDWILILGAAFVFGKEYPLEIRVKR
jgi:hypothetical protein